MTPVLNYPMTFVPGSARCSSALCLFILTFNTAFYQYPLNFWRSSPMKLFVVFIFYFSSCISRIYLSMKQKQKRLRSKITSSWLHILCHRPHIGLPELNQVSVSLIYSENLGYVKNKFWWSPSHSQWKLMYVSFENTPLGVSRHRLEGI